jgi:hypothetical protein
LILKDFIVGIESAIVINKEIMKMNKNMNKAVVFCVTVSAICLVASQLSGCGKSILQGAPGAVGAQGPAGAPGADCTVTTVGANNVAPNGGSLISCPDGSSSLVLNGTNGSNGNAGATGATGATGAAGTNGSNGTVVAPVQFCKGTGSYPSTFPEVGFCINNNLYAVYSANDGFLTEVLPGTWSSDGINSSCTFTVSANCVVTN